VQFGSARFGNGKGWVFELMPSNGGWTETELYAQARTATQHCDTTQIKCPLGGSAWGGNLQGLAE